MVNIEERSIPLSFSKKGYYEVGRGIRGARTDQELVDAIVDRTNETVICTISIVLVQYVIVQHSSDRPCLKCPCPNGLGVWLEDSLMTIVLQCMLSNHNRTV
jgi:hypothetical protein